MKWDVKPYPKDDEVRTVTKFAWFPVRVVPVFKQSEAEDIANYYWERPRPSATKRVWLERYQQFQVYRFSLNVPGFYWYPMYNFLVLENE